MSDEITVTVRYAFRPGMEVIGREILCDLVKENRKSPGCKSIVMHRDRKNPASYLTISHWESMDAFTKLLAAPHIKKYAEQGKQVLLHPFKVEIWSALDEEACG